MHEFYATWHTIVTPHQDIRGELAAWPYGVSELRLIRVLGEPSHCAGSCGGRAALESAVPYLIICCCCCYCCCCSYRWRTVELRCVLVQMRAPPVAWLVRRRHNGGARAQSLAKGKASVHRAKLLWHGNARSQPRIMRVTVQV